LHGNCANVAFNNAGTLGEKGPTTGISLDGWNEALKANLTSAFLAAKHQIPAMLKQGKGSIIFTSTFVGYTVGFPEVAAYAASKSGLIGLTQVLAAEYGPQNIRVNAILPGAVETAMYREANETAEQKAYLTNMHVETRRVTRGAGPGGALSRLRCVELPIGHGHAGDGGLSITRT